MAAIAKLHASARRCMEKFGFFLLRKWVSHIMEVLR